MKKVIPILILLVIALGAAIWYLKFCGVTHEEICEAVTEESAKVQAVVDAIAEKEPEVAACCVPECVYRGFCPEFKPCGFCGSPAYKKMLATYREVK